MGVQHLQLPPEAPAAMQHILRASREVPVLVFKKSPICPISHAAEREFQEFVRGFRGPGELRVAVIDVIAQRVLARGLTAELAIDHESPQALLFAGGSLRWHDSHNAITLTRLAEAVAAAS